MKRVLILLLCLCGLALANPAVTVEADLQLSEDPLPFGKPAELVIDLTWPNEWKKL